MATTNTHIVMRDGIVCGRGTTLRSAISDMLEHVEITPDRAADLVAGDSATRTRYTTADIAAVITDLLTSASPALQMARRAREIAVEREQQRREDRGIYGD